MKRKSDSIRNWILVGLTITTILLGGGLVAAPLRVNKWVREIAIDEVDKRVQPIAITIKHLLDEVREMKVLIRDSIDRELNRGRRP